MLVELAEAYTEALNKGGIPVIETAWEYMQSNELENAYKNTIAFVMKTVESQILPQLPMMDKKLTNLLKELKASSLATFKSQTIGDVSNSKNTGYMKKLKAES